MSNRTAGERTTGRRIGAQDVVSAWMIYLVFLGGLILLSTFTLHDDQADVRLPGRTTPDVASQWDQSSRLSSVPVLASTPGWPKL